MTSDRRDVEAEVLKGTTLKVYRFLFKTGRPQSTREIQRTLNLSSPSLAEYHVKKLLRNGLIREEGGGYVVDRLILENMIRVRRMVIPYQVAYVVFFGLAAFVDFVVFSNDIMNAERFAQIVIVIALGVAIFEAIRAVKGEP